MARAPDLGRRGATRPDGPGPRGPRPHLGTCDLAGRTARGLHAARNRPCRRPRAQRPVDARTRRRRSRAPAHEPRRKRRRRRLGRRRQRCLLPVLAQRHGPGVVPAGRRRRGDPGHASAARRRGVPGIAARRPARRRDRGLPGLPRPRMHEEAPRGAALGEGARASLRPALRPPLGHVGGRPRLAAPLDRAGWRAAAARRAGAAYGGARRRHSVETARRPRGLRVQPGRVAARDFRRACVGSERARLDQLRHLARAGRRQRRARQPDAGQPRVGRATGVFAGRQAARAPRDGPRRLRGRPLPPRGARRRERRHSLHHAGLGSIDRGVPLLGRRKRDPRHRRRPRPEAAVCDRRGQSRAAQADRARAMSPSSMSPARASSTRCRA